MGRLPRQMKSLVDDALEQIGGGLGEGELVEARIDGGEVAVQDLVESVVLHGYSFRARPCFACFWYRSCGRMCVVLAFGVFPLRGVPLHRLCLVC